jgi:hypothetical protein
MDFVENPTPASTHVSTAWMNAIDPMPRLKVPINILMNRIIMKDNPNWLKIAVKAKITIITTCELIKVFFCPKNYEGTFENIEAKKFIT